MKILFGVFLMPLFLFACATTPQDVFPDVDLVKCESPKSQICTREYRPVCGFENDGNHKTFSNACSACSDSAVTSYCEGDCNKLKSLTK